MKKCNYEGCSYNVFGKGFCKQHYPKTPLKKNSKSLKKSYLSKLSTEKYLKDKEIKKEHTKKLHNWFQELWESEPHYSEISGDWLGNENSSIYWHHLYPKNKYPQYEFDRDNIVRLTASEHQECEFNPTKYKYVVDKLELLKKKYEILY